MLRNLGLYLGAAAVVVALGLMVAQSVKPNTEPKLPPPPITPTPWSPPRGEEHFAEDPTEGKVPYSEDDPFVLLKTTKGDMYAEIFRSLMPRTAKNFLHLVETGFYNGSPFHRVVAGFVIQAGAAEVPPVPPLEFEDSPVLHDRGVLSMARVAGDMDSATSSFFICLARAPHLDHQYAAFGRVLAGMEVADEIARAAGGEEFPARPEKIIEARIVSWDEVREHISAKSTGEKKSTARGRDTASAAG